jgi:glycosyltransferase involved in cell wall biosynthesis
MPETFSSPIEAAAGEPLDILEKSMSSGAPRSIILVAFHFSPEALPGAVRPSRFFRYLPEFGYEPEVITGAVQTEMHPRIHSIPAPTYLPNKYTPAGAVEILLHKIAWPTELALLWAGPASARARRLLRDKPVSAVISTGPPVNTHLTAMGLKLRYGLPWVADFRDPMLDNPFRQNLGRIPAITDQILEKQIFHHADAILGVSDVIDQCWRIRYPQYAHKLHVLYNGYDPAENLAGHPIPQRSYRVLAYVGNLYGLRRPEIILNALTRLASTNCLTRDNFRIHFIGGIGQDVSAVNGPVMSQLQESGIMECTGLVPRAQALQMMAESDYLLMLDIQDGAQGYAVPSKIFEYIRMGRPILTVTQHDSPVHRIVSRSGVPHVFVYPEHSEDTVCQKIKELLELPPDPVKPSEWFLETFDGRQQAGTLASVIASVEKSSVAIAGK